MLIGYVIYMIYVANPWQFYGFSSFFHRSPCLLRAPRRRFRFRRFRVLRGLGRRVLRSAEGLEPLAEQKFHLRDVQETWENQHGKSWKINMEIAGFRWF